MRRRSLALAGPPKSAKNWGVGGGGGGGRGAYLRLRLIRQIGYVLEIDI